MILMYHKIYPESYSMWWVDVDSFYRQMLDLKAYKIVYLDDYDPDDKEQVVITFDGVYSNILEYAAPILKKHNYPFELFITSDHIGMMNEFDAVEPPAKFASMQELAELVTYGGRLQFHSKSHTDLRNIDDPRCLIEELTVPERLRALDTSGFKYFAYPHGEFDEKIIRITKNYFSGAVSCIQGDNKTPYTQNRLTVTNETNLRKNSISVIIPSYNYGNFLCEAVDSVLSQTRLADEIVLIDDCSQDDTPILGKYYQNKFPEKIKYHRNQKNLGIVNCFNKAVQLTSSDFVVFLGADNRFRNDYLEKTTAILDQNEWVDIVYTDFVLFGILAQEVYNNFPVNLRGKIIADLFYIINFPEFDSQMFQENFGKGTNFIHGSALYRRSAYDKVGGYLDEKDKPEDYNLFFRMIESGSKAKRVNEPLLEYRQHSREQVNRVRENIAQLIFYKEKLHELLDVKKILEEIIAQKEIEMGNIKAQLGSCEEELHLIKSTKTWRLRNRIRYLLYRKTA